MKKKSIRLSIGGLIIGSAIIWGAVIIGCSMALKGTECYKEIQNILAFGVIIHLIIIWGPMGILFKKVKDSNAE